jgi:hypothetical protein
MASATAQRVINLVSQLTDDERRDVIDAIARRESESVEQLAEVWEAEIERRAERVLSGVASGAPADEVFARIAAKLSKR